MKNREIISITEADLIQRDIEIKSPAPSFSGVISVTFSQVRPVCTVFKPMDRKVQNPEKQMKLNGEKGLIFGARTTAQTNLGSS